MKGRFTGSLLAFVLAVSGSEGRASITIQNPGFDVFNSGTSTLIGVGRYTVDAGANVALYNGPFGTADFLGWNDIGDAGGHHQLSNYFTPPNGTAGYVNVTASGTGRLFQDLGATLQPDTTYTLTMDVFSWREDPLIQDVPFPDQFIARVDAGTTQLPGTVTFVPPARGYKSIYTWVYTSPSGGLPSGNLTIVLEGAGSSQGSISQAAFDDINLQAVTLAVPEPASLSIWGLASLVCAIGSCRRRPRLAGFCTG